MSPKNTASGNNRHTQPLPEEHPSASNKKKDLPAMPAVDDQPQREDEYLSDMLQDFNPQRKRDKEIEPPPK